MTGSPLPTGQCSRAATTATGPSRIATSSSPATRRRAPEHSRNKCLNAQTPREEERTIVLLSFANPSSSSPGVLAYVRFHPIPEEHIMFTQIEKVIYTAEA